MITGFTYQPIVGKAGGTFTHGAPKRLVLHSTEGSSVAGAVAAYKAKGVPPQFTVDPKTRARVQHISEDKAGYALKNLAGGVQTNNQGAIQVEVVGFAAKMQDMSDLDVVWMGTEVVRPLAAATGFKLEAPAFVGADQSPANAKAKQRFSAAAWNAFNGVCGHQHVPENDHWDPGAMRIDAILAFARAPQSLPPVEVPHPPANTDVAQLRRLAAAKYLASVGDLPVPMGMNTPAGLHTVLLQQILNLVFPTASIKEDGVYGPSTSAHVVVFQALMNKLSPGSIDDAFPGAISAKTKFFLAVALTNIRDGKA